MACNSATLTSIDGRCDTSIGGIKRILIANRDDVTATIADTGNDLKYVTSIKLASGKKFEQWRFRKQTGSYSTELAIDDAIGTVAVTTNVALQFTKAEAEKRLAIQSAINASSVVIVEDMFGQYIYLGLDQDVTVSAASMQSGTATSDLNGFTLTLTDISTEMPHFVDPSIDVDALLVVAK